MRQKIINLLTTKTRDYCWSQVHNLYDARVCFEKLLANDNKSSEINHFHSKERKNSNLSLFSITDFYNKALRSYKYRAQINIFRIHQRFAPRVVNFYVN